MKEVTFRVGASTPPRAPPRVPPTRYVCAPLNRLVLVAFGALALVLTLSFNIALDPLKKSAPAFSVALPDWLPTEGTPALPAFMSERLGSLLSGAATSTSCLSARGPVPPRATRLFANKSTTRLILLAPETGRLPSLDEVSSWLRAGWFTLLVEHPNHAWPVEYAVAMMALATPEGTTAAVRDRTAHKYDPAFFAVLRASEQACLDSKGVAGTLFAQEHDVETVVYVRHFADRILEDRFPRYHLPHQRLPVLDVSGALAWPAPPAPPPSGPGVDSVAAGLILQHFTRDDARDAPGPLRLCTQPTRAVLQYGLCQPAAGTPETYLLEEAPALVPRPAHPVWGVGVARNTVAHRQAFWALALLTLAEDRAAADAEDALSLQRAVHCALSRLRFDVATLAPGAICGDPPAERNFSKGGAAASKPDREYGLQVSRGTSVLFTYLVA